MIVDWSKKMTPAQIADEVLLQERLEMAAYRLAFNVACDNTPHGAGTLMQAIEALLLTLPPNMVRQYNDITIFERLRPEVKEFLQDAPTIALSDSQVDDLFRLAMQIQNQPLVA